jgi:hypothetical protein
VCTPKRVVHAVVYVIVAARLQYIRVTSREKVAGGK